MERYCSKLLYKSAESINVAGNKTKHIKAACIQVSTRTALGCTSIHARSYFFEKQQWWFESQSLRGGGSVLRTLSAFLPFVISHFFTHPPLDQPLNSFNVRTSVLIVQNCHVLTIKFNDPSIICLKLPSCLNKGYVRMVQVIQGKIVQERTSRETKIAQSQVEVRVLEG